MGEAARELRPDPRGELLAAGLRLAAGKLKPRAALVPEAVSAHAADPLGYVLTRFPWGSGELAGHEGPDSWQRELLAEIRDGIKAPGQAIQEAVSSGHGIGKSALVAWLILWAMETAVDTRGVVTANTEAQLRGKTWAELGKWFRLAGLGDRFVLAATAIYSREPEHERTWRIEAVAWSEQRPEAFAGLHNEGKRVLVVFDEASAIPEVIWETAEGALTDSDTEILWVAFGNPTRTSGRFRECFGRFRHRWKNRHVDARTCRIPNQEQLAAWVADHGEDSDFVRVRVRGVFPRASDAQFIAHDLVAEAQRRAPVAGYHDPLICGVDVARGGADKNVIRFRRGLDARTEASVKLPGSETRDSMRLVAVVADLIAQRKPDAVFVDETGVGGPIVDRLRQLGFTVFGVQFGGKPADRHYANKRAEMWGRMREWLRTGAIDPDPDLETDLTAPQYSHDAQDRLVLEPKDGMKRRGLASPDDGDALALTFAMPVAARATMPGQSNVKSEFDPYA
jgi:hypothetical protein